MRTLTFKLAIDGEDYLRYYQGQARQIAVVTDDGHKLQFPAEHLRPFVMHNGVHGRFALEFDEDNRFVALRKI